MPGLPASRLAILVPVYRSTLDAHEAVSLGSTFRVLGHHHLVLVKPAGLDTAELERRYPFKAVETFDPAYFHSIQGYNRLLLSTEFYARFLASEFLLICQLDVFVFRDDLARWIDAGYDYIGAPWVSKSALGAPIHRLRMLLRKALLGPEQRIYRFETRDRVGNGGFSLRRVAVHHRLSVELRPAIDHYLGQATHHFHEDVFWSLEPARRGHAYRTPAIGEALAFSWDINPRRLHRMAGGRLPMAAHGWFKARRREFWAPHVAAAAAAPPPAP